MILATISVKALIWAALAPHILGLVLGALTLIGLWFLMHYKFKSAKEYTYAKAVLEVAQQIFGNKLGGKASQVFEIWQQCLDEVQNGKMTQQEMIDKILEIMQATKGITLSSAEKQVVTEVTETSIKMLAVPQVKSAFKISSIKL